MQTDETPPPQARGAIEGMNMNNDTLVDMEEKIKAEITPEEGFWLWIMRRNKKTGIQEIRKKWQIGRMSIAFNWRSKSNLWGRFGGGWNWEFGFQAGGTTVILMLFICTLRISWK